MSVVLSTFVFLFALFAGFCDASARPDANTPETVASVQAQIDAKLKEVDGINLSEAGASEKVATIRRDIQALETKRDDLAAKARTDPTPERTPATGPESGVSPEQVQALQAQIDALKRQVNGNNSSRAGDSGGGSQRWNDSYQSPPLAAPDRRQHGSPPNERCQNAGWDAADNPIWNCKRGWLGRAVGRSDQRRVE